MPARLLISEAAYELQLAQDGAWTPLATLAGGAQALLPPRESLGEAALERAIEVAEDWLMPHAARLRGEELEVVDGPGRLREGAQGVLALAAGPWSVSEVESMFLRLVDLATGRQAAPALLGRQAFVADVLMLRELAHHGRLVQVRIA